MLKVKNEIGTIASPIGSQLLAGVPTKPADQLVYDAAITNGERIKVDWLEPT